MTELKTLKDLQFEYEWKYDTLKSLRQEAIKWWHEIDNNIAGDEDEGAKKFIEWFFNLTSKDLKEFQAAISSTSYTMEDDEFEGNFAIINPDAIFSGKFDPINQLPQSDAGFLSVIGDTFTSHEVDDPTFGGVFPNWTQDYLKNKMIDWEMLDYNASPLSSVKSVPSSNSTVWSHSGWFGYFLKESNPESEKEFWAYHQHFGWIYIASLNTSSVWLFNPSQEAWIWTAPTLFPFIYNYSSQKWQFLLDDKILTWDQDSRSWD